MSHGKTLDYINQVQIIESFAGIKGDLEGVTKALYVVELVDGFGAEANSNPALFTLAVDTLPIDEKSCSRIPFLTGEG